MILWWEDCPYPFTVQPGDILFIGGRLPRNSAEALPFEHVALVSQDKLISTDDDLLDLRLHGIPESATEARRSGLSGILQTTGRFLLGIRHIGTRIGSPASAWNLVGRLRFVDTAIAAEIAQNLALSEGALVWDYEPVFRVDPTLAGSLKTNCLGFVCSIIEHHCPPVLEHKFPDYTSPFNFSQIRDFPSPGHLAHVLYAEPTNPPWRAVDQADAEMLSRVDHTLEALAAGAVP
jgi:hypothetical protein